MEHESPSCGEIATKGDVGSRGIHLHGYCPSQEMEGVQQLGVVHHLPLARAVDCIRRW